MAEFIAQHTPAGFDDFTRGYFEAMEWLLQDEVDRAKLRGFTRAAILKGLLDCETFRIANYDDLAEYRRITGLGEQSAGCDFFLSRNGHGTGFFDRGMDLVFGRLQIAAKHAGATHEDVSPSGWIYHTGE